MLRITFQKPEGSVYWVEGRSMDYNGPDGYRVDEVQEDSRKHGPVAGVWCPPDWRGVRVEQV